MSYFSKNRDISDITHHRSFTGIDDENFLKKSYNHSSILSPPHRLSEVMLNRIIVKIWPAEPIYVNIQAKDGRLYRDITDPDLRRHVMKCKFNFNCLIL